jgi:type I site-specific restriction endonuclease
LPTQNKIAPKKTVTSLAAGILPGMQKHFTNGSQVLTFGGGAVTATVDETVTNLKEIVANRAAVTDAQSAVKKAVAAENAALPALVVFLHELEAFIRLTFGADPTVLDDFSLAPPKARTPLTAEQKAVAKAKAKATREARGTASAKAKKAIKGNVSATLVVTPAAPETPAATTATPTTAPAAAAAAASGTPNATTPGKG